MTHRTPCPIAVAIAVGALLRVLTGCSAPIADRPINPSFPITFAEADAVLAQATTRPVRLRRPLLIVGGFADPGLGSRMLRDRFRTWTGDARVIDVSLCYDNSFDDCRRDIVAAVDAAYPTDDPNRTTEVDVIGASMGGLAARYAAIPMDGPNHRRLRIGRLFTIGSPLRGASLADRIPLNLHPLQPGMRTGSGVIRRIESAPQSFDDLYAIYSYVRLRDDQVGSENAAVPGATAWWVSAPAWPRPTHHASFLDHRILADIVSRLRGEPPLSHDPPAPLPTPSW